MSQAKLISLSQKFLEDFEIEMESFDVLKAFRRLKEDVVIFTDYSSLGENHDLIEKLSSSNHLEGIVLSVDPDIYRLSRHSLQQSFGRKILDRVIPVASDEVMARYAHAWNNGAQDVMIGDFMVDESGNFFLADCHFKMHSGDLRMFEVFKNATIAQMRDFKINRFGSYIEWPALDVHLDLSSFKSKLDPKFRQRQIEAAVSQNKKFGEKMRGLREEHGLTQSDFDLSDKQIRRYENGEMFPTYKSLETIAKTFKLSVTDYIAQVQAQQVPP